MVLGITGGVGSGKSTVLDILQKKHDAYICMADELGHRAMQKGTSAYRQILEEFGNGICRENGEIDREKLAQIVYNDHLRLEQLNAIIHPFVKDEIQKEIAACDPKRVFVLETAILFETGCDDLCDEVWAVITEDGIRLQRLMDTRGYSPEKAKSIMNSQLSNEKLAEYADRMIENNGDIKMLERQIQAMMNSSA